MLFSRLFYIKISLVGLLLPISLFAQEVKSDIKKINQAYAAHTSYHATIEYALFASHESNIPHQTLKGMVQNKGSLQYTKISDMETLINQDYALMINHDRKTISIQPAFDRLASIMPIADMDSLLTFCEEIQFHQVDDNVGAYDFYFGSYDYERIRVVFDQQNYVIKRLIFFQTEPVQLEPGLDSQPIRMEIQFQNIRINQTFPLETFSECRFLEKKDEHFQPISTYSSYQLVNFLPKN